MTDILNLDQLIFISLAVAAINFAAFTSVKRIGIQGAQAVVYATVVFNVFLALAIFSFIFTLLGDPI